MAIDYDLYDKTAYNRRMREIAELADMRLNGCTLTRWRVSSQWALSLAWGDDVILRGFAMGVRQARAH